MYKRQRVVAMMGDDPTVGFGRLWPLARPLCCRLVFPLFHIFSDYLCCGNFISPTRRRWNVRGCWTFWAWGGRGDRARRWRTCWGCLTGHCLVLLPWGLLLGVLLFHIVRLLLRFSERVFLVLVLAFFDLITFNCVFQFLFLIAMTWYEKVMLGFFYTSNTCLVCWWRSRRRWSPASKASAYLKLELAISLSGIKTVLRI